MKKPSTITITITASLLIASILFIAARSQASEEKVKTIASKKKKELDEDDTTTTPTTKKPSSTPTTPQTPTTTPPPSTPSPDEIHKSVEDIDKRGKTLFKSKDYLPAAECFTEALDLLATLPPSQSHRQIITITNNRSAMYEKAGLHELALDDCDAILRKERTHLKARLRKLRVLEADKRFMEALVEVCVLQLNFMNENRDKIRLGLPIPNPPVTQTKIEDICNEILPAEIDRQFSIIEVSPNPRPLPSFHTTLQLLQSFDGYNKWMADAARNGNVADLTKKLEGAGSDKEKATLLFRRGVRQAYDRRFEETTKDMEAAMAIVEKGGEGVKEELMTEGIYAMLLEWVGMCRHLRYDLKGALKCYDECSKSNPSNPAEILVKRAGVKMDDGDHTTALQLFSEALTLDPTATDALLHRANLHMLRADATAAKKDLNELVRLNPRHLIARLRLATIDMTANDLDSAEKHLKKAADIDERSSEVHSYRGEMYFAKGEVAEAKREFDLAMECDPTNPTPYVNAALAVMNMGSPSEPPDVMTAVRLFERAIAVDPQFHTAYVQLGQLKLSTATNLEQARDVVRLYDEGIESCRTKEELKEICNMRLLTVAQIDAAAALGMETLKMQ